MILFEQSHTVSDISKGRLRHIDVLRGLAVCLMIEQHLGVWTADHIYRYPLLYALNGLGGMAAPLFVTLAGFGAALTAVRHDSPVRVFLLRGIMIMGFGYLLNLLVPSWFSPGSFYVLHLIGAALILTPALKRLNAAGLVTAAMGVLILTVMIQYLLHTPIVITNHRMGDVHMQGGVFRLILAEGHFPLFPWLAFFMAGMAAGIWHNSGKKRRILQLGFVGWGCSALIPLMPHVIPALKETGSIYRFFRFLPRFYPALPPITLFLMASALILLYLTISYGHLFQKKGFDILESLGRTSLTLLTVHVVCFRELFIRLHWFQTFSQLESAAIVFGALAGFAGVSLLWRTMRYRFSLEWVLRKAAS